MATITSESYKDHPPVDYAEAAKRYGEEAANPDLSEIERRAKQDIADYADKRAKEILEARDTDDTIPSLVARHAMKQALAVSETPETKVG